MSSCPKCQGTMETGFLPDTTYGGVVRGGWAEGPPQKSWLGVLSLKGKRRIDITAERCTRCGYLELYAKS